MQLTARVLRTAPVAVRRLGIRAARSAWLRNEPPAGVWSPHGGRQLMRKPLDRTEDLSGFGKVWLRSWSSVLAIRALHGVGRGVVFRFAAAGGARCVAAAVARK